MTRRAPPRKSTFSGMSKAERTRQSLNTARLHSTPHMSEAGKAHMAELESIVKPKRIMSPRNPDDEPLEHDEQAALVKWWFSYSRTLALDHRLLVAIPNAQIMMRFANNAYAFMGYLTAEGFRKGMFDLVLFVPRGYYHGLCIEMKRRTKGILSPEQKEMAEVIGRHGYFCMTCYGADDAIVTIKKYLGG